VKKPEEFLKQNPGSVIFARYAEHLEKEGQVEKAIEILEKGIEANPSYAFGHSVLANILRGRQIPKRVTAEFKKALELDPQSPSDMMNFGQHYLEINQYDKAISYLEIALKFEPGHTELRSLREEALNKSKAMVDLGLSDETTGALTNMFGEVRVEETDSPRLRSVAAGTEQEDSGFGEMLAEEVESVDFEEAEEELFAQSDDMAGESPDTAVVETELLSEEDTSGDVDISSLMKSFREEEEKPVVAFEMAEETEEPEEPAPVGQYVVEEDELSGVEDLESLMKSFGGEDVDIEEPDTGIRDEGSDPLRPLRQARSAASQPAATVRQHGESDSATSALQQDVTNLLSKIDDKEEPFIEIDETGDYDLSQFESEVAEDEPVLSEDERTELLSYEQTGDEDVMIEPDTEVTGMAASGPLRWSDSATSEGWESPLKDLLEGEVVSDTEAPEIPEIGTIFGDLSMEEIDVLSEQEMSSGESAPDLESEMSEGIDYSDVLAEVSDKKVPDIEETLDEAQPFDEQIDSIEEERKGLSYSDKMILDMGEVAPHDDEELSDLSMFSDTGEMDFAGFEVEQGVTIPYEEESPGEVPDDMVLSPETVIESADERLETVHRVEEMIKLAPDFELSIDQDDDSLVDIDVKSASVDHLLDEYLKTLTETSNESECIGEELDNGSDGVETYDRVSLPATDEETDRAPSADPKEASDRDATATMAEIYISQGFVSRGIDIYRILLQENPDNEQYESRLRELESMQEQSSEGL